MKQISQKEIDTVMESLMQCNIPVKVYAGIQELFNKLPAVEIKVGAKKE